MKVFRISHWQLKLSLFLNYIVFAILLNSVGTVILEVINHYNVTKSSAGNLDAFKDLSIALFSFVAASFLPRLGYKKSMLIGLAIVSVTCYFTPIIDTYWMIKILLVSVGIGFALIKVSAYSIVGLITDSEQEHASFISILEGIFMLGMLSGFWLFGQFVGLPGTDWLDTFWVIGGLATLAFLLLLTTPLDETGAVLKQTNLKDDFLSMLSLYKESFVIVFIISIFLYVFIEQGITNWLPTFNNKVLHISAAMSIEMASIFSASIALGRLVAGVILKKMNWFWLLVVCIIGACLMVLIILPQDINTNHEVIYVWHKVKWIAFVFPLIGFFLAPIYPTLCSTALSTLPKYRHSAMMSLIMIFSAIGGTVGSKIVGWTFGKIGGHYALGITLIPLVILLILLFPYKKLRLQKLSK